jgi:hypothetical protein
MEKFGAGGRSISDTSLGSDPDEELAGDIDAIRSFEPAQLTLYFRPSRSRSASAKFSIGPRRKALSFNLWTISAVDEK